MTSKITIIKILFLCAQFCTLVSGQSIIGAWQFGDGTANNSGILVFLTSGIYFHAEDIVEDTSEFDGMERGTYNWNQTTGNFTATQAVDTNGEIGLSHPIGNFLFTVSNNTLTAADSADSSTLTRAIEPTIVSSADVNHISLTKFQNYDQLNDTTTTPRDDFIFLSILTQAQIGLVSNITTKAPSPSNKVDTLGVFSDLIFVKTSDHDAANLFDTNYPFGNFILNYTGQNDGVSTVIVNLPTGDYPQPILIKNISTLQGFDFDQNITISWEKPTEATQDDIILILISDKSTSDETIVFRSGIPGDTTGSQILNGTDTSLTIQGNTLEDDKNFGVELIFFKKQSSITGNIDGGGYLGSSNNLNISTGNAPSYSNQRLFYNFQFSSDQLLPANPQNDVTFSAHLPNSLSSITFDKYNLNFNIKDSDTSNIPASLDYQFPSSSPFGATGQFSNRFTISNDQFGWSTNEVNFSNQAIGGAHIVTYKGTPLNLNLTDPNQSNRAILLWPTIEINTNGNISTISWELKNSDGVTDFSGDSSFISTITIDIADKTFNFLSTNRDIPGTQTSLSLADKNISYDSIGTITIRYSDDLNNLYNLEYGLGVTLSTVTISSSTLLNAKKDTTYNASLDTFTTGYDLVYDISSGDLPSGLSLNEKTGVISGTPDTEETNTFEITVEDAFGFELASASFTINVGEETPFDSWIDGFYPGSTDQSIIARTADPDKDGIINFLEYFFFTNPTAPDAHFSIIEPDYSNPPNLKIKYTRISSADDIEVTVYGGSNINSLQKLDSTKVGEPITLVDSGNHKTVERTINNVTTSNYFVYLKIDEQIESDEGESD